MHVAQGTQGLQGQSRHYRHRNTTSCPCSQHPKSCEENVAIVSCTRHCMWYHRHAVRQAAEVAWHTKPHHSQSKERLKA
jgi:hypothetical protein